MIKKILKRLLCILRSSSYTEQELIKIHGGKIGQSVFIGQQVLIDYDYCFLLEIGDGATISARTIIEFHDSCLPNVLGNGKAKIGKIIIGKRAYIGVNSVILAGVKIGNGAIVGACSLVNRDIPPAEVWGGIPVRYICTLEELRQKRQASDNPNIACVDWIGEIEKRRIDYKAFKSEFIHNIRSRFQK